MPLETPQRPGVWVLRLLQQNARSRHSASAEATGAPHRPQTTLVTLAHERSRAAIGQWRGEAGCHLKLFRNEPVRFIVHGLWRPRIYPRQKAERPAAEDPLATPRFEDLFDAELRRLHSALCLLTGDPHDAEELAQDAFVRVWEQWGRVSVMADPTGYLYRTAMNGYRSRYRRALVALRAQFSPREAADSLAVIDDRDAVVRRLDRLTRNQRAAVVLLDLLDFTSKEAAAILNSTPGAVRTQASRGRAALRQTGGDPDA